MKLPLRCSRRWRAASCAAAPKFSPCRSTMRGACALVERRLPARGGSRADRGSRRRSARRARATAAACGGRARIRPAHVVRLPCTKASSFCGVVLVVFSGLTTGEDERAERVAELAPVLPVLAKAIATPTASIAAAGARADASDTTDRSPRCASTMPTPNDELVCDLEALEREERLLGLIDTALREDEFALHLQPIVSLRDDATLNGTAHRRGADSPADAGVRRPGLARVPRHRRAQRPHAGDRPLGDPRAAGVDAAQSRSLGGCQRGVLGESLGQVGGASGFSQLSRDSASTSPACR